MRLYMMQTEGSATPQVISSPLVPHFSPLTGASHFLLTHVSPQTHLHSIYACHENVWLLSHAQWCPFSKNLIKIQYFEWKLFLFEIYYLPRKCLTIIAWLSFFFFINLFYSKCNFYFKRIRIQQMQLKFKSLI